MGNSLRPQIAVVTEALIQDGAVTESKIGANAIITAKIKDVNVTIPKLAAGIFALSWEVIGDQTMTETVDRITFTDLDLVTDRAYLVLFTIRNLDAVGDKQYKWYLMGDFTDSHYQTQELKADGASVSASRTALPITYTLIQNSNVTGYLLVENSVQGYPTLTEQSGQGLTGDLKLFIHFGNLIVFENTTQIDIRSGGGSFIRAGSRVILMKLRS